MSSLGHLCPYISNDWTSQSASLKQTSLAASSPVARDHFFGGILNIVNPSHHAPLALCARSHHPPLALSACLQLSRASYLSTATSLVRMNQEQIQSANFKFSIFFSTLLSLDLLLGRKPRCELETTTEGNHSKCCGCHYCYWRKNAKGHSEWAQTAH